MIFEPFKTTFSVGNLKLKCFQLFTSLKFNEHTFVLAGLLVVTSELQQLPLVIVIYYIFYNVTSNTIFFPTTKHLRVFSFICSDMLLLSAFSMRFLFAHRNSLYFNFAPSPFHILRFCLTINVSYNHWVHRTVQIIEKYYTQWPHKKIKLRVRNHYQMFLRHKQFRFIAHDSRQ